MLLVIGSRLVILILGYLYPAYASYKAVRNKDVKAYVQWMMYWIVFAMFTTIETFSDVLLSWMPFYYEIKIILVLWLLSPATKGSSLLYRKFVHPALIQRENEIDECISKFREKSYAAVIEITQKSVNYAMKTALQGGGGLLNHLKKSYSLSDLGSNDRTDGTTNNNTDDVPIQKHTRQRRVNPPQNYEPEDSDEMDVEIPPAATRGFTPRRSASVVSQVDMYFPAVDVDVRSRNTGKSTNALTSNDGDSGLEVEGEPLIRTASLSSTRTSSRTRRSVQSPMTATTSGRSTKSTVGVNSELTGYATLPRSRKTSKKKAQ